MPFISNLFAELAVPVEALWVLAGTAGALVVATVLRLVTWVLRSPASHEARQERLLSLVTWWLLFAALTLAVLGGPLAVAVLFLVLSLVGLAEYRRLTQSMVQSERVWPAVFAVAFVHYGALYLGYADLAWIGTPLAAVLLMGLLALTTGRPDGFLRAMAIPLFGLMLIVYCLSYAAIVAIRPLEVSSRDPSISHFVFLVLLTELHDIAQALWGRTFGRHKITPKVSPGKTWEGLLLGTATTLSLAAILTPLLDPTGQSPLGRWALASVLAALCGGLIIAVSGFLGDITMSAVKRACGVKDSSKLLPGQGGVLDRVDSLTFAAPAFYYYTLALASQSGE